MKKVGMSQSVKFDREWKDLEIRNVNFVEF